MNQWIPADPSKIAAPYSVHLHEEFFTSVEEGQHPSFTLSPNPATNELRISINGIDAQRVDILDVLGRLVHTRIISSGIPILELSVQELAHGTYSLRLSNTERNYTQRFVKY